MQSINNMHGFKINNQSTVYLKWESKKVYAENAVRLIELLAQELQEPIF